MGLGELRRQRKVVRRERRRMVFGLFHFLLDDGWLEQLSDRRLRVSVRNHLLP